MSDNPAATVDKVRSYTAILISEYGTPALGNKADAVDELVFIVLSEKTDDPKYSAAYEKLKFTYPDWQSFVNAPVEEVEPLISSAGMGKRRAELLQRMLQAILDRFGTLSLAELATMTAEEAESQLIRLPGVGRKAARCVLLYCFGFAVLPVDVHTYRLAVRLGMISRCVSYDQSHCALPPVVPAESRHAFHVNAVAHGRSRCFAHNPRCSGCPLFADCSHPKSVKPLDITVRPKPLAIDLFAGSGGLSLGFENAGCQIVQAVEQNRHVAATYRRNHPRVDLLEKDLCELDPTECLQRLGLRPRDLTVLIGGPPCQGFSESNRRTRNIENPKNHLYQHYIRFLKAMQPAWFIIENVAGLRTVSKGVILERIIEECRAAGYVVDWALLNAADYGVPQMRHRLFIVGNRMEMPISFPKSTVGTIDRPYITVKEAIDDLPILDNGATTDCLPYRKDCPNLSEYQVLMRGACEESNLVQGNLVTHNSQKVVERYKHISQGQNWTAIPSELLDNYCDVTRCHTGIYYRLMWDKPSKVIGNFRKNMLIHPEQHRGLSVREAARLQSFPDCHIFLGSIGFQQQQVADAVPPLLSEAVATSILRTIAKSIQTRNEEHNSHRYPRELESMLQQV